MGEAAVTYLYQYETRQGLSKRTRPKSALMVGNREIPKRIPRKSPSDVNATKVWEFVSRKLGRESQRIAREIHLTAGLDVDLAGTFEKLATQWKNETKFLSSITDKALHPSYQRIIGLGPDAIPIILMELRTKGGHWFWALESITGVNPVLPEHYGDVKNMVQDWLAWGQNKGYLL
jgi:hypothetical protein